MAKSADYSVGLAVDGSAARKGIETGLIDPVEDAQKALTELGKNKGPDQLEKGFKEAADATKKLEKETKETADTISDEFRRSYARMKDAQRDATRSAEEGLGELKDESRSTAKEAAASFDGSAESIIDTFQEVAANAFAGFGPAGLIAGVAVAAGIGTATEAFGQNQEKIDQAKQKIREYGLAIIETGQSAAGLDYVTENLKAIVTNSDDATKKLSDIQDLVKKYPGLAKDTATLAKAYAGNTDAIKSMLPVLEKARAHEQGLAEDVADGNTKAQARADALQVEIDKLKEVQNQTLTAKQIEDEWLANGGQEIRNKAALIDQVNSAYDDAAGAVEDYVNEETGVFDTDRYVDAMNKKLAALGEYQTLLANSTLSTSAKTYLSSLGSEAASQLMQAYKNGTDAQKANLDKIWAEAGRSNSGQYLTATRNAIPDRLDKTPKLSVDTQTAETELGRFIQNMSNKTLTVTVVGKDRAGRPVF